MAGRAAKGESPAALRSQAQASSSPFAGGTAMAGRAAKGESPPLGPGSLTRRDLPNGHRGEGEPFQHEAS
jgi:hypothetical protein